MEMKRKITVQSIFWRFLLWFCVMAGGLLLLCIVIFLTATTLEIVYPANYSENMLEKNRTEIETAAKVTKDMIPPASYYGVYAEDGTFLYGNLEKSDRKRIWHEYKRGGSGNADKGFLKFFQRKDEVCIASYDIKVQFVDPKLRKYLPGLPESLLILFAVIFITLSVLLIRRFSRKMSRELLSLKQVTEKVKLMDLDFEKPKTCIYEIDEVMESLMRMKEALAASLKKQWAMEEQRHQQVRALVHDIKTPLTIIRGNTQLIGEAESEEESRELQGYILKETDRIERYVRLLQEMLISEGEVPFKEEKIDLKAFAQDFFEAAAMLASAKGLKLEVVKSYQLDYIISDRQLLRRAWENILHNAVEFTRKGGTILITMKERGAMLYFQVEDDGPGFTQEDIRYGTNQFYQGDKSRGSGNHYGMGLFIVQSFMNRHGGRLVLENSKNIKGACVRLEMNTCCCLTKPIE